MKKLFERHRATLLLALLAASPLVAQSKCPEHARDEQALIKVERAWIAAYDQRDVAALSCLLAPEYHYTGYDGKVSDRSGVLTRLAGLPKQGDTHHELQEVKPVLFDNTAVVYGTNRVFDADGTVLGSVRFTDVFVYRDGRWLAVAEHESRVQGSGPGAS